MAEEPHTQGNGLLDGPVANQVQTEKNKTRDEFSDLANSRKIPDQSTATGQDLTHYHSMFYRLLSWKNPRATAISFLSAVVFIFASRYLHVVRYLFKIAYMVFGLTAAAELAGKAAFGNGFVSQMRPRKYFTIRKDSLERLLDDFEQLLNFFVIESQRIVFAENVYVTVLAFVSAFISYWLVKWVPLWGLSLIGTTLMYMCPLIYMKNQELIDAQIEKGREIFNQQTSQMRDLAAQHSGRASDMVKSYTSEYTNKAQEMLSKSRGRQATHGQQSPVDSASDIKKDHFPAEPMASDVKEDHFPSAPATEPVASEPTEPVAPAVEHEEKTAEPTLI